MSPKPAGGKKKQNRTKGANVAVESEIQTCFGGGFHRP